jgi:hypothetical protein
VDADHEEFELEGRKRGDGWRIWRRRFWRSIDKPSLKLIHALSRFTPLFTRVAEDGAYIRAAAGPLALLPTISATVMSLISLAMNQGTIAPPTWQLFLAIAVIGIFDTLAGFIGTAVFVIGSLIAIGGGDINEIRMLLGVIIVGYGPALLANAFRAFRKIPEQNGNYIWERIVDLGVLPFMGGWVTASMIATLPALAGSTLAVANHVNDFALAVAAAIAIRVILEEGVSRYFPERLNMLHPTEVIGSHSAQKWVSVALRLGVFIFVTAALMGNDWRTVMGSALFVAPTIIGWYSHKFPNYPWLWRILPNGVPGLAFTLVVASLTTQAIAWFFGATPDLALWSFALLPIPMLVLSVLHILGREGLPDEIRWIKRPGLTWVYRIGGIVMLLITMKLAGVI